MKKVILIIISAIYVLSLQAQPSYRPALQKGSLMVNGSVALSLGNTSSSYSSQGFSSSSEAKYNSFTFSPQLSGFITNGFAIGLLLDLTQISTKTENPDSKGTSAQFTAGPSIKYYAPFGFFVNGNVTFGKNKYKYTGDSDPDDGTNISKWQLGAGYAIFLNDHVSIEPGLLFRSTSYKRDDSNFSSTDKLNEFVFNIGFNIFIHKKAD